MTASDLPTLVRAQLLALCTTRSLWVTTGALLAFTVGALAFAVLGPGDPPDDGTALTVLVRVPGQLVAGACLVLGVLLVGGEHRHRTRVLSALAEPRRGRLLVAQLTALAVTGAAVAAVVWSVAAVAGASLLLATDVPLAVTGALQVLVASVVGTALLAVLGGALAGAVGGTSGALGIAFGWLLVLEGVVPVVLRRPELADRLPGGALTALLSAGPAADRPLHPAGGALALAVLAAALVAVAHRTGQRREL
jgi:hypothetical protein